VRNLTFRRSGSAADDVDAALKAVDLCEIDKVDRSTMHDFSDYATDSCKIVDRRL